MAFAGLGAAEVLRVDPDHAAPGRCCRTLPRRWAGPGAGPVTWPWPEPRLTYANAVLAGRRCSRPVTGWTTSGCVERGLGLLGWLLDLQTPAGAPVADPGRRLGDGESPARLRPAADRGGHAGGRLRPGVRPDRGPRVGPTRSSSAPAWFFGRNDAGRRAERPGHRRLLRRPGARTAATRTRAPSPPWRCHHAAARDAAAQVLRLVPGHRSRRQPAAPHRPGAGHPRPAPGRRPAVPARPGAGRPRRLPRGRVVARRCLAMSDAEVDRRARRDHDRLRGPGTGTCPTLLRRALPGDRAPGAARCRPHRRASPADRGATSPGRSRSRRPRCSTPRSCRTRCRTARPGSLRFVMSLRARWARGTCRPSCSAPGRSAPAGGAAVRLDPAAVRRGLRPRRRSACVPERLRQVQSRPGPSPETPGVRAAGSGRRSR